MAGLKARPFSFGSDVVTEALSPQARADDARELIPARACRLLAASGWRRPSSGLHQRSARMLFVRCRAPGPCAAGPAPTERRHSLLRLTRGA